MKPIVRILVPVAFAALAAPAWAQSNRCIDKDGKTVYMERPCATYGYRTEKQIKDPPKGDGTGAPLKSGQAVIGSPTQREGGGTVVKIEMMCGGKQVQCTRGDTLVCGTQRKTCDSD